MSVKITSKSYTGGSSLNISYAGGCDTEVIEKAAKHLQMGEFNGMSDSYDYKKDRGLTLDGKKLQQFRYVFVHQEFSDEFWFKLAKFLSDKVPFADIPALQTKEDYTKAFPEIFVGEWRWSELIKKLFKVRNFQTQDESKIELLDVHANPRGAWDYYFVYSINGAKYDTREYITEASIKLKESLDAWFEKEVDFDGMESITGIDIWNAPEEGDMEPGDTRASRFDMMKKAQAVWDGFTISEKEFIFKRETGANTGI